jgi:YHS domain-containing protein
MTGARRRQKVKLCRRVAAAAFAMLSMVAVGSRLPADAATTGYIISDRLSGLACGGFDPVAYFTGHTPQFGNGLYELKYRGVVWRFSNEGNKAAFARNPEVYVPVFGGYDPVALTRGVAVPGHPLIWLVSGSRVYLFSKPANRDRFVAETERIMTAAGDRWPGVAATLVP